MFASHDEDGRAQGHVASLIETAKINGIKAFAYLEAIREVIPAGRPQSRIDDPPALKLQAVKPNPRGSQPSLTTRSMRRTQIRMCSSAGNPMGPARCCASLSADGNGLILRSNLPRTDGRAALDTIHRHWPDG
ncbi:transposase domain-containing protein [Sinirhodobacter populi]|uniref:Transposase domain-containing protein n=1 Tax=Paenirhodobacter populi TaxID=2306993 RepID=A0A443K019_9RHOB|nr:transposase domain-containing protein [Sinirhodobacter populi]RWR26143.1 transposase domain-containing protein [Sinirhodobacter populi]